MEPAKALASYGLDSSGAVEIRGWMRMELGAELMTLGVANAKFLAALRERVAELILVVGGLGVEEQDAQKGYPFASL